MHGCTCNAWIDLCRKFIAFVLEFFIIFRTKSWKMNYDYICFVPTWAEQKLVDQNFLLVLRNFDEHFRRRLVRFQQNSKGFLFIYKVRSFSSKKSFRKPWNLFFFLVEGWSWLQSKTLKNVSRNDLMLVFTIIWRVHIFDKVFLEWSLNSSTLMLRNASWMHQKIRVCFKKECRNKSLLDFPGDLSGRGLYNLAPNIR